MVDSGSLCLLLVTFGVCTNAQGVFYPFGSAAGDTFSNLTFNRITGIQPFPYFSYTVQQVNVGRNGYLSVPGPGYGDFINVFFLNSKRANVSYQEYTSGDVLHTATQDINSYFPNVTFAATWVFVVTWDRMVYERSNGEATFQAVLISDGHLTFALINYGDISPTDHAWISYTKTNYAYVHLSTCFPNGKIIYSDMNTSSNVNVPGRWVIPASFNFNFSCFHDWLPTTPLPQGDAFYPFGSAARDTFMSVYRQRINLLQPFSYLNRTIQAISVDRDGYLMVIGPRYVGYIKPLIVNSKRAYVSYQAYTSGDVLHTATRDINAYFPDVTFTATWVFVATWDRLVYSETNGESTFQVVVISDGDLTFSFMNYGAISQRRGTWIGYTTNKSYQYYWYYLNYCYPNRVIDVENFNTSSNINVPGRWVIPHSLELTFSCSYPRTQPDEPTSTPLHMGDMTLATTPAPETLSPSAPDMTLATTPAPETLSPSAPDFHDWFPTTPLPRRDVFYPFGSAAGDTFLTVEYQDVTLLQSFPYFNHTYQKIYVYQDGVIYLPGSRYSDRISPFMNYLERGSISHQQYTSGDVLHTATQDVNSYFPDVTFTATWVFVATWDRVVYERTNDEATFQVVLISDGHLTFFFMNYGDISPTDFSWIGYSWKKKDSVMTTINHCYPNAIIDYVNLKTSSNINVPGRWVIPASYSFNFSCSYPRAQPDKPTATPLPQGDQPIVTPQPKPDESTVTPLPQQAIGNVICSENFMAIEVNKTQSEQIRIHEDHLRLNDPSCTLYSNGTHVFANMSLNTCGTVMEEDATDVIFKNEIVSVDGPNDIITRHHLVKIEFFCKYPKKSNVILEFDVHRAPYTFIQKGFGTFTYQFEFFQSSQFRNLQDPSTYPLEYDLGEMMYMQIEGISPVNNTELFVESCKASPSDDPNAHVSYSVISDGCNQDETVQFYSSHANIVRFGMKTFKFIGLHDQVFITCSVILCEAGNPNTRCSQGCSNTTAAPEVHHQHRREASAAPIQTLKHYISQGPLRLRRNPNVRDAASTVATDGLSMNLVFVAGCLLAAVGMVCGVLFYTKRPQVVYQPLPSFDGE